MVGGAAVAAENEFLLALCWRRFSVARMRRWALWITLLLLAVTIGWFWLLSHDLTFTRLDEGKPEKKVEGKKG
jgi:hypothetical protein